MKTKQIIITLILAVLSMSFIDKPQDYKLDKQQTKAGWIGRKVTGQHSGNISISDGKLTLQGKKIIGGGFTMDMNSITNTDLIDEGYNQKLIGHLKSDDFFSTAKYPTSTLLISHVKGIGKNQYKITGRLTIKGITNLIEFPATVSINENLVKASAKILVDRTKYDIKYGSGSFFDNLGDKAIDNLFELNIDLIATK